MKKTTIKAVEMVRRIRDTHYEQLRDKSPEERIAFYRIRVIGEAHQEILWNHAFRKSAEDRHGCMEILDPLNDVLLEPPGSIRLGGFSLQLPEKHLELFMGWYSGPKKYPYLFHF